MKKFLLIFISLLLGVVIGVGVWHGIAYKDELKTFADNTWSKIESAFKKADETSSENPSDTIPTQEEFNADGCWLLSYNNGDSRFVYEIEGSTTDYCIIHVYHVVGDGEDCLFVDISQEGYYDVEIVEDDRYIDFMIGGDHPVFDKETMALYMDFSHGQRPSGFLIEMTKFDLEIQYAPCEHTASYNTIEYYLVEVSDVDVLPSSTNFDGIVKMTYCQCDCSVGTICPHNHMMWITTYCADCGEFLYDGPNLSSHNYVDGYCSDCGFTDPNYSVQVDDGLTWVFNDDIPMFGEQTISYSVNFMSNGQAFCGVEFSLGAGPCMRYMTDGYAVCAYEESNGWLSGVEYKTVTFETAPDGVLLEYLQSNATQLVACSHSYDMGVCEFCGNAAIHYSMMGDEMFEHMTTVDVESDLGCCTLFYESAFNRFEYDFVDYKLCLGWLNDNYYFFVEGNCQNLSLNDGLDISFAVGHFSGLDYETSTIV